jgi:methylmalonyl-CoA/ethylmalonyl-CoA epimerase
LNLPTSTENILPKNLIKRFDHFGIAVRDVEDTLRVYNDVLGGKLLVYKEEGSTRDYTFTQIELCGLKIEFISPIEGKSESFLTKFIEKHGEGMHHLTFQVSNIAQATRYLRENGLRIVDEYYEDSLWRTAFISPRSARGVLIQLYETTAGSRYDG